MTECRSGYTYRNGKCSKRSNNPFKMWQSYVGGIILPIIFFIYDYISHSSKASQLNLPFKYNLLLVPALYLTVGLFILGFLLGWVLTILYRRFLK